MFENDANGDAPGDVRGALEAAIAGMGGGDGSDEEAGMGDAPGASAQESAPGGETPETPPGGRSRDEAGRFAAKAAAEGDPGATSPETSPPAEAAQPFTPPEGLNDEDRSALAALPPEARAVAVSVIERSRKALTEQARDIAVERRFYGEMRQPMQAVAACAEKFGRHPAEVVKAWASVQNGLLTDPAATIAELAERFGVDLSAVVANPPSPQETALRDAQRRLQELEAWVGEGRVSTDAMRRQSEQAALNEVGQSIAAFAAEKGPDGQPLRPYFTELRDEMAKLISTGHAKDLPDAYDKAVWANQKTRADMLRRESAKTQAAEQAERAQRAAKARAAAGSVAGSPGAAVPPSVKPPASVEEAVQQALRAHSGGV